MAQGVAWRAFGRYLAALLCCQSREAGYVGQQYASMGYPGERADFVSVGYTTPVLHTVESNEREEHKDQC